MRDRYDDIEVELVESGGGAFEVRCDSRLIFSKHGSGRFPTEEEIFNQIDL